jgi:lipopolysaccharide/colanic/teichoic acid biosynthesis glycosyltransferase
MQSGATSTEQTHATLHRAAATKAEGVYNRVLKRGLDLLVLMAAHLLLLPVWLLFWALVPLSIWLWDRGPVLYRQERIGRGGRAFSIYKFRTMVPHADRIGPQRTEARDVRITPVGRVLRRTALDELPQILAIWAGHMSFVGPRPISMVEHKALEKQIPGFSLRLSVRPGLTGLAQVYDGKDDPHRKLEFDLNYISRMSLWLDLKLLAMSVLNTVFARWDARTRSPRD